jgi:hypothetical protein
MLTAKVHAIFKGPLGIRRDIALSKVSRMYTGRHLLRYFCDCAITKGTVPVQNWKAEWSCNVLPYISYL